MGLSTIRSSYLVTTSTEGSHSTREWDGTHPIGIGHPFRWIVEKTARGVRIRNLDQGGFSELTHEAIEKGTAVELPKSNRGKPISIRIRPIEHLPPAFLERKPDSALIIFSCSGNWVLDSRVLHDSKERSIAAYNAKAWKKTVFKLRKSGESFELKAGPFELEIRLDGEAPAKLAAGGSMTIEIGKLAASTIHVGTRVWRFSWSSNPSLPAPRKGDAALDLDSQSFQKALRATAIGLLAFLALTWLWPKPKPKTEELIPPQFAKVVLSKPKTATQTSKQSSAAPAAAAKEATQKKVQEAAVVQAFRAKALSNAVSGLLKGGMTKLMSQSNFLQGSVATAEARRMFDAKPSALSPTTPDSGVMNAKNVAVAMVGGATSGKAGEVGYTKGERAGVKGQGGSFVSMDTGGSTVEEGLTKDEVGEVIHRHLSEVRYCYESAMVRTPDIEGKLIIAFTIGGSGSVKTSDIKTSTLPDPRLDDCILRRLMTWKFPKPRGGVDVAVSYPFIFKTLGR